MKDKFVELDRCPITGFELNFLPIRSKVKWISNEEKAKAAAKRKLRERKRYLDGKTNLN